MQKHGFGNTGNKNEIVNSFHTNKKAVLLLALYWRARRWICCCFSSMIKKYNKHPKEKLPEILPHTLRHTFCTNMANKNMPPKALQYIMGHKDVTTTLGYYAHGSAESAKAAMESMTTWLPAFTTFLTTSERYFMERYKQMCEAGIHNKTPTNRIEYGAQPMEKRISAVWISVVGKWRWLCSNGGWRQYNLHKYKEKAGDFHCGSFCTKTGR